MCVRPAQVTSLCVAVLLLFAGCSENVVERSEPTGQLLIATTKVGSRPADIQDIVATLDIASGVYEELLFSADHVFSARWRPDGSAFLVEAIVDVDAIEDQLGPSLYVADSDELVLSPLEASPRGSSYAGPDWGPTCDAIVARRDNSLWQVAVDGSTESKLVDLGGVVSSPDWASDGSRLAFERRSNDAAEIWVLERDGSGPTLIVGEAEGHGQSPRLSPSGDRLLFIRSVEHDHGHVASQLFLRDLADGGGVRQLTEDADSVSNAVWSPDGEWIAFSDGAFFVTTIRADGSDLRRSETKGLPLDWGPVTASCGEVA